VPLKSADESNKEHDALVVVSLNISKDTFGTGLTPNYLSVLLEYKQLDPSFEDEGGLISTPDCPIKKLVYSPVGPTNRDYDDVRRFYDAAYKGVKKALKSGAKRPLVTLPFGVKGAGYNQFDLVSLLGAYEAIYVVSSI